MLALSEKLIEWRAARIKDPIARLRFLHKHMETRQHWKGWRLRKGPAVGFLLFLVCMLIPGYRISRSTDSGSLQPLPRITAAGVDVFTNVWLVDKTDNLELYSNGLRIDTSFAVSNEPRGKYPVFRASSIDPDHPEWKTDPVGIIFHTTESDQVPFEEDQNGKLKRISRQVLAYLKRTHAYHYLIDRFGQVYRVVQESDAANHSGNSVWADNDVIYVNLNTSFFGIAFETQTQPGEDLPSASPAQIHSARVLTQMLRSKYHIPQTNCVTHAQVSVNPLNMLVGLHTDWSGNFPFQEVGLDDNYAAPPPSIYAFGFDYDPTYVHATGVRIWQGLALAEDQMRSQAVAKGLSVPEYRSILRKKYKEVMAALKAISAAKEKSHAT